jgi:hypothetical protein
MAVASQAGRVCVSLGALPWAPRQVSVQRNGPYLPPHLNRQCVMYTVARPVQTVVGASAARDAAHLGAVDRCPAPCRELARDCRWASQDGEKLVGEPGLQELRPLGALPWVACPGVLDVLPGALHWVLAVRLLVGRQVAQAEVRALA